MTIRFSRRINLLVGGVLVALLLATAVLSCFYTPYMPMDVNLYGRFSPPGATHWFGTDEFGRDVLSRLMAGAGVTTTVSVCSVGFALVFGTSIGVVSGYFGGWIDRIIVMFTDALMAFPGLLLALGIMTVVTPSQWGVVLALGLAYTPSVTRIARGMAMSLRERDFVTASKTMGNGHMWILFRHILPHCVAPLLVFSTSLFGSALLAESALSFLGLGVPAPYPSWGGMLADGRGALQHALWLILFPGAAISLALFGINLLGDGIRDFLDPRMSRSH